MDIFSTLSLEIIQRPQQNKFNPPIKQAIFWIQTKRYQAVFNMFFSFRELKKRPKNLETNLFIFIHKTFLPKTEGFESAMNLMLQESIYWANTDEKKAYLIDQWTGYRNETGL